MLLTIMLLLLVFLILCGMPLFLAMGLTSVGFLLATDTSLSMVAQRMTTAVKMAKALTATSHQICQTAAKPSRKASPPSSGPTALFFGM